MDENAYGTPRFLRAVHAGLHNKYLVHCEKVEELWRSFTPSQREQVFRAGLRGNQVLKDPHDQSLGRSYTVISEMNLRDIAGSPDHFLDHFEFRATTSLMEQYRTGLEGALGDHQVVMQSMIAENTEFDREYDNQLTFFVDEERYGESFQAESRERYKQVLDDFESAVRAGLCVPRGVGQLILERQCYLIKHLCILVEDILNLGVIIDESQTQSMTPTEEARIALSTYPAEVYPEPVCVQDLLTAIYDRKTSFEAYWGLVRSNPVFLASAVDVWYSTRPDLVPDEKGRRMPLVSDEYVSRAIFEVIHNSVIGTAIWDILFALLKNFLEASDDPEQSIILQEISNICNYEYDRIRKDFKRIVQVGIGCKHFKRLSNVFDSATPRVTLKGIPDRLQKEDPQLHYILRLCQSENGASQAVRWITMLDQLHHKQPLEQDRLEEREYDALGEIAMTVNLVNALIVSLELPSASPKKGLTYISKLKELMARLDPLKAHTNLRRLSVSIDDIKKPDMAKEALSIVDRFSEYYAGGPMVPLYQALNKEYLEDLEAQMQEAKATQKTKTKHSSTKSVGDSHPMSETRQQGQGHKTHSSHSSRSTNRRASASEPEVSAQSRTPIRLESPANSETRAKLETPIKADESTNTSTPTQVEEVEVLEVLPRAKKPTQPQIAESETLAEPEAATTSPRSEELVASAQAETSTEPEPEISSRASISVEFETSAKPSLSSGSEISANPKSLTESVTPVQPETTEVKQISQPEMSGEPEIAAEVEESTETAATSEHELLVAPDPYAQLTTSAVMQASSALKAGEIEPHSSHQPETPAELQTNTEHGTNEPEQTTVKPETTGPEVSAEVETSEALGEPGPDLYAASKTTKPEPSNQVDISPESGLCTEPKMFESDPSIKAEMEPPIVPDTSTKSEITEVIPEVFKVQPSTLAVFSTLFSEPESESDSSDAAAPAPSIKWLAFGAAMVEIGFTIVPNIGSLYTFVPGDNAESHAFFTLHRPYREVIQGASLVHLASRLKKLYGWGRGSFEAL